MVTKSKKPTPLKDGEQVGVKLDPDLFQKFQQIAQNEERTLAQLARIAIREFVERRVA